MQISYWCSDFQTILEEGFFCGEEEKQRRTRRKIFAKGKLIFCEGEEKRRRKIFGEGKYIFVERETERKKEENTRRRKIFVCGGSRRKRKKIFGEGICLWMPIVLRKKYLSIFWKMAKSLWEDQEINFYWEIIGSATEGSPIKQETISVGEMFWNSRMMYFGPLQLLILLFYSWQIQESRIKMYKFKANQSYPDQTNLKVNL